jgi:MFS family permease
MPRIRGTSWAPVIAHTILVQIFTYAFRPALAYGVLDTGASVVVLGLIGTVFAVPALALALPSGRMVDRLGERPSAIAGAILLILAAVVALVGLSSVPLLLLATFLLGLGHLFSIVSEQAIVANRSVEGARESAFGIYTFAASVGQVLGPLLLAIPGPNTDAPWLPLLFGICIGVACALLVSSLILTSAVRDETIQQPGMIASSTTLLRSPGVLAALISSSLALSSVDVTLAFWPALGEQRALPAVVISGMLAARALFTMVSRGLLPFFGKRIPRRHLLTSSLLVSACALGATALPVQVWVLIALASIYGLAIGLCQPVTMAWLADESPHGQKGMAMSLRLVGNRIGQSTVPAAVGLIAPAAGVAGVVGLSALTLVGASIISLSSRRNQSIPMKEHTP